MVSPLQNQNTRGLFMVSKKSQSKAGVPARRRGQQMGDETSQTDKTLKAKEQTPALRGRRQSASKFFADESAQAVGSDGEAPRDNTPSVPAAIPTGEKLGESGGEKQFKERQKALRKKR
jgi:hypothetical protein